MFRPFGMNTMFKHIRVYICNTHTTLQIENIIELNEVGFGVEIIQG